MGIAGFPCGAGGHSWEGIPILSVGLHGPTWSLAPLRWQNNGCRGEETRCLPCTLLWGKGTTVLVQKAELLAVHLANPV